LNRIIENAEQKRRGFSPTSSDIDSITDVTSFQEIVGDYQSVLKESREVLHNNSGYLQRSSPLSQLDYNFRKRPDVDRLIERLTAYNGRVQFFLKPFELDLLQRIYQKVSEIHDVVVRGVIVQRYEPGTRQLDFRISYTVSIPEGFDQAFSEELETRLNDTKENSFPLSQGAEALIMHLKNSTRRFIPDGYSVEERTVSPEQYINLLKCVWILNKLKTHPKIQIPLEESHWPSYIANLSFEVSKECRRFSEDSTDKLVAPDPLPLLQQHCSIWPKVIKLETIPRVYEEPYAMMSKLLELPLKSRTDVSAKVQLVNAPNGRMKILTSGIDHASPNDLSTGSFEFNIGSAHVLPMYAEPVEHGNEFTIRVHNGLSSIDLPFNRLKDALDFQHGITGYRCYKDYCEGIVDVRLILRDQEKPLRRKAYMQLWQHAEMVGTAESIESIDEAIKILPSDSMSFADSNQNRRSFFRRKSSISTKTESKEVPSSLWTPISPRTSLASASSFSNGYPGNFSRSTTTHRRDSKSGSSSSTKTTSKMTITPIYHGNNTFGLLYQEPKDPLLVLFLYDESALPGDVKLSMVSIRIDAETELGSNICFCLREKKACKHLSIIQSGGQAPLMVKKYDAAKLLDWDVLRFRSENDRENQKNDLENLIRVSVGFNDPERRDEFYGKNCKCRALSNGGFCPKHAGLFERVKAHGVKNLWEWENKQASRRDVITDRRPSER
jgi:hypothetical protein